MFGVVVRRRFVGVLLKKFPKQSFTKMNQRQMQDELSHLKILIDEETKELIELIHKMLYKAKGRMRNRSNKNISNKGYIDNTFFNDGYIVCLSDFLGNTMKSYQNKVQAALNKMINQIRDDADLLFIVESNYSKIRNNNRISSGGRCGSGDSASFQVVCDSDAQALGEVGQVSGGFVSDLGAQASGVKRNRPVDVVVVNDDSKRFKTK